MAKLPLKDVDGRIEFAMCLWEAIMIKTHSSEIRSCGRRKQHRNQMLGSIEIVDPKSDPRDRKHTPCIFPVLKT